MVNLLNEPVTYKLIIGGLPEGHMSSLSWDHDAGLSKVLSKKETSG